MHELDRHMLRVASRTAISHHPQMAAFAEALCDGGDTSLDVCGILLKEFELDLGALVDLAQNRFFHGASFPLTESPFELSRAAGAGAARLAVKFLLSR